MNTIHRPIAAILANPRYTGRQVWNRQPADFVGVDPNGGIARHQQVQRRNPSSEWAISEMLAHPPLVSEQDFVAVQTVHTAPVPADGTHRDYLLGGLVCCGICGRTMEAHWLHQTPAYRCRHGHNSTRPRTESRPRNLYIREDQLVTRIQHDRTFSEQHPQLRTAEPRATAAYLHTHNMIIV